MKTLQGSFDRRVKGPILGCLLLCALFFTGARFAPIGPFFSAAPRHGDLKIADIHFKNPTILLIKKEKKQTFSTLEMRFKAARAISTSA